MIHYHGTPITPNATLHTLAGRHFCVSYAAPAQVKICHQIGQSVMLDNGAFSLWRAGKPTDWGGYYRWSDEWLAFPTTWAVIPDIIDGTAEDNDALIAMWPHGVRGAPVWHMHEPVGRLVNLCTKWPRVCVGSSGQYASVGTARWHDRMAQAFNALADTRGRVPVLHLLRGMSLSGGIYPFASVDSTDVARNHHLPHQSALKMAAKWDAQQCPAIWANRPTQMDLEDAA
jgi:hypothetical protein